MVTEEAARGTAAADIVFESVRKLFLSLHAMHIDDEGGGTTKELCHGGTVVNGRCVRENGVSGDVFVTPGCVNSWIR
jgi:hypothetical protein